MHILPWTNPLVGTAFMLRARRGTLLSNVSLYVVVLIIGMVAWQYFLSLNPGFKFNPHKVFLMILFGAQCFLSGILMMGQAGAALKNEVMNKTLDFQRIAAMSPWDILLGKMLGMPVMSYLLALSALPVAVFTLLNGAPGVTIIDLFLLWLQILTFLFLLGACCIQNTLQISSTKSTGASPGFGIFIGLMGVTIYATFAGGDSVTYLNDPRRMSLGALFSPLTGYAGIAVENPWAAKFYWFTLQIPCLLFTPVAHMVIAWFVLSIMARRLENVDGTPLGKRKGYLMLILADLLIVGILNSCGKPNPPLGAAGFSLQQQVGLFLLLHGLVSIVYFISLTPRVDQVMSWIWRFRTDRNFVADSLLQDRAPNTVPVLVNLIIGALSIALLCAVSSETLADYNVVLEAGLTLGVTIVFLALFFQALHLGSRKYGTAYLILFVFLVCLMPFIAGGIMRQAQLPDYKMVGYWLLHMTPFSQALQWIVPESDKHLYHQINPYPVVLVYLVLAWLTFLFTWRWLNRKISQVESTKARLLQQPASPEQELYGVP